MPLVIREKALEIIYRARRFPELDSLNLSKIQILLELLAPDSQSTIAFDDKYVFHHVELEEDVILELISIDLELAKLEEKPRKKI